jgi:CRP-like cAMP-binding protein
MENKNCHSTCVKCPSCPMSVFNELNQKYSDQLSENKIVAQFKKGETIFHQGLPSNGVYCIEKGKVKISSINAAGSETIFFIASSGDLIGYETNPESLTTATVLEECTACMISNDYLRVLFQSQSSVPITLLQHLIKRTDIMNSYSLASVHLTALKRVANLLVTLARRFGVENKGNTKIDLLLTRQEMASMIGTASETMIRCLTELKQEGIVAQEGNFLTILDIDKLNELT